MHEFEYKAPKPKSTKTKLQWFKIITLRVFFPPILLWDLLSILVNALAGPYVAKKYFDLEGKDTNWDYMQERCQFYPSSDSPEDMRNAILSTQKTQYDDYSSSCKFDIDFSDEFCKITASGQTPLKEHLIFLRLFEGTKNFALFDVAELANGTRKSNLLPTNATKFSHTSARVTCDDLVNTLVSHIENLVKNGVAPNAIHLGKNTQRLANAIINLAKTKLAEKNIVVDTLDIDNSDEDDVVLDDNFCFESHRVITYDQSELETFEIQPSSQRDLPISEQKYLIKFPVANTNSEYLDDGKALDRMIKKANRFQCNVVGFNFRGKGKGKGQATSIEDCITDGIAQVQRLLDKGVSPRNILVEGYCLGGAIATLVAKYFNDQGQTIGLFNDRSFSNATNILLSRIRAGYNNPTAYAVENGPKHEETWLGICKAFLATPFVKLGLLLTKFEIEAAKAYQSLPEACKEYMVVKSSKHTRGYHNANDDQVILDYASLHKAVKYTKPLFAPLNSAEKSKSDTRKMELHGEDIFHADAHGLSRKKLKSRVGITRRQERTADKFYADFVNQYFKSV